MHGAKTSKVPLPQHNTGLYILKLSKSWDYTSPCKLCRNDGGITGQWALSSQVCNFGNLWFFCSHICASRLSQLHTTVLSTTNLHTDKGISLDPPIFSMYCRLFCQDMNYLLHFDPTIASWNSRQYMWSFLPLLISLQPCEVVRWTDYDWFKGTNCISWQSWNLNLNPLGSSLSL